LRDLVRSRIAVVVALSNSDNCLTHQLSRTHRFTESIRSSVTISLSAKAVGDLKDGKPKLHVSLDPSEGFDPSVGASV